MLECFEAKPDPAEIVKKEFAPAIKDDKEWHVIGTIAKDDIIKSWVDEVPTKLAQKNSVKLEFDGYTLHDVEALKEMWSNESPTWPKKYADGGIIQQPKQGGKYADALYKSWFGQMEVNGDDIYFYNVPQKVVGGAVDPPALAHQCPLCRKDRHDQPLRQRVLEMLSSHRFDPNYDAGKDDSPIMCVGSDTYGPNRAPAAREIELDPWTGKAYPPYGTMWEKVSANYEFVKEILAWPKWEIPDMPSIEINTWIPEEKEENESI